MKADANPLKIGSTSIRGNGRATIKAHSATPHHTRPYGSRISPARMESLKIVSVGIIFLLCSAILLLALMVLRWDAASRAHAHALVPSITSSPPSGPVGATISVSGSGLSLNDNGTPVPDGTPITFGYSAKSDCSAFTPIGPGSNPKVSTGAFNGTFAWPTTGISQSTTYTVCVRVGNSTTALPANTYQVLSTSAPSISVTTYQAFIVGKQMTVAIDNFYPSGIAVSEALQSADKTTTVTLGTVTTDLNGSVTQVYKMPKHPTGSVVVIATYIYPNQTTPALRAASSTFTIKPKPAATPTPTPKPILKPISAARTTPTTASTPTPAPTATDTPLPVSSPTLTPTVSPAITTHAHTNTTSKNLLTAKLPSIIAVGVATLLGLGILFVIGYLLLRGYVSPAPAAKGPRSAQQQVWSPQMNSEPPGETMPLNVPVPTHSEYGPDNGSQSFYRLPAKGSFGPQQAGPFSPNRGVSSSSIPFNNPILPARGGFTPDNGPGPQTMPFNGPLPPNNEGTRPTFNSPVPSTNEGLAAGNGSDAQQVPFNGPFPPNNEGGEPGNDPAPLSSSSPVKSGFAPRKGPRAPFLPANDWFSPPDEG